VITDSKVYPLQDFVPYGINAVKAFEVSDSLVSNRKVCIIDSGYDINHPDLPKGSTVTGSANGAGPWDQDGDGHGTHVAGTIAAISNGEGVVGVARNGELQLHIVRVFRDDGEYAWGSDIVNAVSFFVLFCAKGR
jgi:serine protease